MTEMEAGVTCGGVFQTSTSPAFVGQQLVAGSAISPSKEMISFRARVPFGRGRIPHAGTGAGGHLGPM